MNREQLLAAIGGNMTAAPADHAPEPEEQGSEGQEPAAPALGSPVSSAPAVDTD